MKITSKVIGAFLALVFAAIVVPTALTAPQATLTASVVEQPVPGR